uniref:TGB2 n=1 Tax=Ferula potexvirus 1 TaxID=2794414 RepID=A0A7T5QZ65_9VIRU|nr:TGB2 [Ferula potexvirus 1]
MPLRPPADYSSTLRVVSVGICLVALTVALTRSTLPAVGDTTHSLPHGGFYRDGTKCIKYHGPAAKPVSNLWPVLAVILIPALLYALRGRASDSPSRNCNLVHCQRCHPPVRVDN